MPEWMHNRAEHILAKNPSMPKSEAFAIATQQMHSLGKGPKGYGTPEGRATAKAKFNMSAKMEKKGYMESLLPGTEGYYGDRMREVLMGLAPRVYTPFGVEHTKLASCMDELQKIAVEKDSGFRESISNIGKALTTPIAGTPEILPAIKGGLEKATRAVGPSSGGSKGFEAFQAARAAAGH
jgi:hypothetical protein